MLIRNMKIIYKRLYPVFIEPRMHCNSHNTNTLIFIVVGCCVNDLYDGGTE